MKKRDLTGLKFGKLTVIKEIDPYIKPSGQRETRWLCKCDCGSELIEVIGYNLVTGNTYSCGCHKLQRMFESFHKTNKYDLSGEYGIGYAINTNNPFYFDLQDYNIIKDYCWYENIHKYGYHSLEARDYKNDSKLIRMHYLFGMKGCDHIDRNPLNNRRNNLRFATSRENARNTSKKKSNTSGFIGVSYYKPGDKWRAYIETEDGFISLGYYFDIKDAVKARLKAEKKYFKDFAPQQDLFKEYGIM